MNIIYYVTMFPRAVRLLRIEVAIVLLPPQVVFYNMLYYNNGKNMSKNDLVLFKQNQSYILKCCLKGFRFFLVDHYFIILLLIVILYILPIPK